MKGLNPAFFKTGICSEKRIPAFEGVAKSKKALNHKDTKAQRKPFLSAGCSLSRSGKNFVSPCLCGSLLFRGFCHSLLRMDRGTYRQGSSLLPCLFVGSIMNSGAVGKDSSYSGLSHGDYRRSNNHATSSSEQKNAVKCHSFKGKRYLPTGGLCACSAVSDRSVSSEKEFNYLNHPDRFVELKERSDYFGMDYDGRNHSRYATLLKRYTSMCKRPLSRNEQNRYIPSLLSFKTSTNWSWFSLTAVFHSFTAAGVFTVRQGTSDVVRQVQESLLKDLLDCVLYKCNHRPEFSDIDAMGIANLLWAVTKLVDNGQELIPAIKETVDALLAHVIILKGQFVAQGISNLLWALAKLVDKGYGLVPKLKEAVAVLLPLLEVLKDQFNAQEVSNLWWAMGKLAGNGYEPTSGFKEPVAALSPRVKVLKDQFNAQEITNLLWALAKLADNWHELTSNNKEVVAVLLPRVKMLKNKFTCQGISSLLWAMAKFVINGGSLVSGFKETLAALLPRVHALHDEFVTQDVVKLIWAISSFGDLINTAGAEALVGSLLGHFDRDLKFSRDDLLKSLWGLLVCSARLYLEHNTSYENYMIECLINRLFNQLESETIDDELEKRTMALAAGWLGRKSPVNPHYQTVNSATQSNFCAQIQSALPFLKIEQEKSLLSLPPVDLLLPEHNIAIEIQGPWHYVGHDFQTRNGSTLLKKALLQKAGYDVLEIPVVQLDNPQAVRMYIDQIHQRTTGISMVDGAAYFGVVFIADVRGGGVLFPD